MRETFDGTKKIPHPEEARSAVSKDAYPSSSYEPSPGSALCRRQRRGDTLVEVLEGRLVAAEGDRVLRA